MNIQGLYREVNNDGQSDEGTVYGRGSGVMPIFLGGRSGEKTMLEIFRTCSQRMR